VAAVVAVVVAALPAVVPLEAAPPEAVRPAEALGKFYVLFPL
jgi:hypothetical protein